MTKGADWFQRYINLSRIIICLEVELLRSLYVHIYIFFVVVLKCFFFSFLTLSPVECNWFLKRSIWPNGTLTNAFSPGKNESGSNGNEGLLYNPSFPELKPYHQMQFIVIPMKRYESINLITYELKSNNSLLLQEWLCNYVTHKGKNAKKTQFKRCILFLYE